MELDLLLTLYRTALTGGCSILALPLALGVSALMLAALPLLSIDSRTGTHGFSGGGAFASWIFSNLCGCTAPDFLVGAGALLDRLTGERFWKQF
jgi:hypothetical protein